MPSSISPTANGNKSQQHDKNEYQQRRRRLLQHQQKQLIQMYQMMQTGLDEIMNITKAAQSMPEQIFLQHQNNIADDDDGDNTNQTVDEAQMNERLIGGLFSTIESVHVVAYSLSRLIPPISEIAENDYFEEGKEEEEEEEAEQVDENECEQCHDDDDEELPPEISPLLDQLRSSSAISTSMRHENQEHDQVAGERRDRSHHNHQQQSAVGLTPSPRSVAVSASTSRNNKSIDKNNVKLAMIQTLFGSNYANSTAAVIARETGLEVGLSRRDLLYGNENDENDKDDNHDAYDDHDVYGDHYARVERDNHDKQEQGSESAERDGEDLAVDSNVNMMSKNTEETSENRLGKDGHNKPISQTMMPSSSSLSALTIAARVRTTQVNPSLSSSWSSSSPRNIKYIDDYSSRIQQSAAAIRNLKMKLTMMNGGEMNKGE